MGDKKQAKIQWGENENIANIQEEEKRRKINNCLFKSQTPRTSKEDKTLRNYL